MPFKLVSKDLNGLILLEPQVFGDSRGFFMESYRADQFEEFGIPTNFVQDNHSKSQKGVLRGMHFQWDKPQGKLIRIVSGRALVVEIDIRKGSPSFGKHKKFELSENNKRILWVPPGFANGFLSLSDGCEMLYKCTALWNSNGESNIIWNDPVINIEWDYENPIISEKDKIAQSFNEWIAKAESNEFKFK